MNAHDPSPNDAALSPPPRGQQLRWLAIAAVAVGVIVALALWISRPRTVSAPTEAPAAPDTFRPTAQQLKTLTIEPAREESFAETRVVEGRIVADGDHTTSVYAPYAGRVTALRAGVGDRVARGAPLATLEALEVLQAENDFVLANAQRTATAAALERKRLQRDGDGVSLAELQQAEVDATAARAAAEAAEHRLRLYGLADDAVKALRAGAALPGVVALQAPVAGIVVDRAVGPGQYVQSGSGTALFTLTDPRTVWVVGQVPEDDATGWGVGSAVDVRVAASGTRVFHSKLNYVASVVDPSTHRVAIRATLANPDGILKPDMLATLQVTSSDTRRSPAVPRGAVLYEGDKAHVWVMRADGTLGLRAVKVGRSHDEVVEILSGLAAGERIVTRGAIFIDTASSGA